MVAEDLWAKRYPSWEDVIRDIYAVAQACRSSRDLPIPGLHFYLLPFTCRTSGLLCCKTRKP